MRPEEKKKNKTACSNLFNTNNSDRCSQMYPWWPPWLCHYLHGREDGPEHLTPWLLNVSERPFLPSSFYKKRHLGPSSYSSVLGVICQHLYDTAWGSEWVLVVGVIAGSPPSGFSGVDRDIIYLSLRLHQIVFLLEEKYWPTLMVRPSEQVTNRNRLFLCTRFLYQKQILFWKKKKRQWLLESNRRSSSLMSSHGFNLSRTPPWIQDPRISLQTPWCPAEHHAMVVTHGASFHASEVPPFFPSRSGAHYCKLHIPWNKLGDSKMYFGIFLCWHSTWNMEVSTPVTYRTLVW